MQKATVRTLLNHVADTFFEVSGHGMDTFFYYLQAKEKIFTDKYAVAAIFFTEIAVIGMQLHL